MIVVVDNIVVIDVVVSGTSIDTSLLRFPSPGEFMALTL